MLSRLTECSILMLKVILEMYTSQKITRDEFLLLSEAKVQFLTNNIDTIQAEKEKKYADDILKQIKSLISQDIRFCSPKLQHTNAHAVNQGHSAHL